MSKENSDIKHLENRITPTHHIQYVHLELSMPPEEAAHLAELQIQLSTIRFWGPRNSTRAQNPFSASARIEDMSSYHHSSVACCSGSCFGFLNAYPAAHAPMFVNAMHLVGSSFSSNFHGQMN